MFQTEVLKSLSLYNTHYLDGQDNSCPSLQMFIAILNGLGYLALCRQLLSQKGIGCAYVTSASKYLDYIRVSKRRQMLLFSHPDHSDSNFSQPSDTAVFRGQ